jgi:hypothetical protein
MPNLQRLATLTSGDAQNLTVDWTTDTDWPTTELGIMAAFGETNHGTWVVRVPDGDVPDLRGPSGVDPGTKLLSAHNVFKVLVGSNTLYRGRIAAEDVERGDSITFRNQRWSVTMEDYNADLHGIVVHNWSRPEETDAARVQALAARYLSGNPRPSTNLNGSNYVITGSNTITMPAKTYTAMQVSDVLTEISEQADKEMYVDVDGNLHYHGINYTGFDSIMRISDDLADLNSLTFLPIEPKMAEESREHITALRSYYGPANDDGNQRSVSVALNAFRADYWEQVYYDDASVTPNQAQVTAANVLQVQHQDPITYTVRVGMPGVIQDGNGTPMSGDHIWKIKAGQRIAFKAKAVKGGIRTNGAQIGDEFLTTHIRAITWTMPTPDAYYADLQLEKPRRIRARAMPKATTPRPAPEHIPDPGNSTEWFFKAADPGGDTLSWSGLLDNQSAGAGTAANGTTYYYYKSGSPTTYSNTMAWAAGDSMIVDGYIGAGSGDMALIFTNLAPGTYAGSIAPGNILDGVHNLTAGYAGSGWVHFASGPHVAPTGTTSFSIGKVAGGMTFDEVQIILAGTSVDQDDDAIDYGEFPHDSPFFLPSDYVEARLDDLQSQIALLPDAVRESLSWKMPVRVATTAAGTLATSFEAGDTIDGVTLAEGDRILIKDQATGSQNGVYLVAASGAPTRTTDFDDDEEVIGAVMFVTAGTANADSVWMLETETPTIGTTALVFSELSGGGGSYTDEQAQDAVGGILTDTSTVDLTYNDATPSITAAVIPAGIKLDDLGTPDDNTDLNSTTSQHGLLKKLDGSASKFLDGSGNWSTPTSGGGGAVGWIQDVDQDGSSFAAWTAHVGTWASTGTIIQQTQAPTGIFRWASILNMPLGFPVIMEAEVRLPTTGQGTGADVRAGIVVGGLNASPGPTGGVGAFINCGTTNRVHFETVNVSAERTVNQTVNKDQWYKIRVSIAGFVSMWVDGTLVLGGGFSQSNNKREAIAIATFNAIADFRNIKVWIMRDGAPA